MPNSVQAGWQGVEEASGGLAGGGAHDAVAVLLACLACGLAVPEVDGFPVEGEDSAIADGDPVGVSGEGSDYGSGAGKGPLGVDHPFDAAGLVEVLLEGPGALETGDRAVAGNLSGADGPFRLLDATMLPMNGAK